MNLLRTADRIAGMHAGITASEAFSGDHSSTRAMMLLLLLALGFSGEDVDRFYKSFIDTNGLRKGQQDREWQLALYLWRNDERFKERYAHIYNTIHAKRVKAA
jgi:hypothetical protein